MIGTVLGCIALLQLKHLLADFFWQTRWMVDNKGRYGHPGGMAHAGLHAAASALVLSLFPLGVGLLAAICAAEFVLHYHIDWLKELAVRLSEASPADKRFWDITGADQALHQVTYLGMAWVALN
jgi:hypothetical protein